MRRHSQYNHFDVLIANSELTQKMENECVEACHQKSLSSFQAPAAPAFLIDSDLIATQSSNSKCCALLKKRNSTDAFRPFPNKRKPGGGAFVETTRSEAPGRAVGKMRGYQGKW